MIDEYKFGFFKIDGKNYTYDIKIADNKTKHWPDREGYELKLENIQDLIDKRPEVLIIGTGGNGMLIVPERVKSHLYATGIKFVIDKNVQAIKLYNEYLNKKKKICAIFPATC